MVDFKSLNQRAVPLVINIKKGIDTDENFNLLLKLFDPVIKKVVGKIKHNGMIEYDDLYQEAVIALYNSCFDYDSDNPNFYSFYYSVSYNRLCQHVYKFQTHITFNKHEKERTKDIRNFSKNFFVQYDRYPTSSELVDFGFNEELVKRFEEYNINQGGLSNTYDELIEHRDERDSIETLIEYLPLYSEIDKLDDDHKQVLKMYFFDGMTLNEISNELELSMKQVRNKKAKAIEILKDNLKGYE